MKWYKKQLKKIEDKKGGKKISAPTELRNTLSENRNALNPVKQRNNNRPKTDSH